MADTAARPTGAWSPLRIPAFRMLWIATLASNVGTWMHDIGASWLMLSLAPSPVMVALIQTATTLPIFLLAMPAGALSDIIDRRRYLLVAQLWLALVAALLGFVTLTGIVSAWMLLALTFAMGVGTAMMMPAWAAVTPELVPRSELQSAIALNSLGINVGRAIGPALAGVIVSFGGPGAVFALNAISYVGVIVVLYRWRREASTSTLPGERFTGALRAGFRFALHAPELHAAAIRGAAFFLFASATWALLPLVASSLANSGPQTFGVLVASLGAGAVLGAASLPALRKRLTRDALVAGASLAYAAGMLALAGFAALLPLCVALALSGAAWISVLSSLQAAAQMALPNWVRSRGLAAFMTVFMGSMAGGSLAWGSVAQATSVATSLSAAAVLLALAVALTWRWRIGGIGDADLTPSMHWPQPVVHDGVTHDRGPVLVTIDYRVSAASVGEFLVALRALGAHRRRDGAFTWGVFEHSGQPNRFVESFYAASWLEHLRQHDRVTDKDRLLQQRIHDLLEEGTSPQVDHYVAPDRNGAYTLEAVDNTQPQAKENPDEQQQA